VVYDFHYSYSYSEDETKYAFPDYHLRFGEFWNENIRIPLHDDYVILVRYSYLEERLNDYNDVERIKQLLFISQETIGDELSRFALEVYDDDQIDNGVVYCAFLVKGGILDFGNVELPISVLTKIAFVYFGW
jgi:hypothetical protein